MGEKLRTVFFEIAWVDVLSEWEIGHGAWDGGARARLFEGVFFVGGGSEDGVGAQVFEGYD